MKKLLIPILLISGIFGVYEQSKDRPNIYITCASIVIFMICMMLLSSKLPSKHEENNDNDV
ncbi:MAG: hypothetical protein PSV16_07310 [Flavobacterium sp.]|nr:hypothetical protein [Flavobacterium sp.]